MQRGPRHRSGERLQGQTRLAAGRFLPRNQQGQFARFVNDFPRDRSVDFEKKLTTRALHELVAGRLTYKLVRRRRQEG